jgi:hypothetical protein
MFVDKFLLFLHSFVLLRACGAVFSRFLGGWYGSNRPMTAFQAVSSSIEAVLEALFCLFMCCLNKRPLFSFVYYLFDQILNGFNFRASNRCKNSIWGPLVL